MKHSPGPWRWDPEAHSLNVLRASDGLSVAIYDRSHYGLPNPYEAGDRALLSLAPQMAEMLRSLEWSGWPTDGEGNGYCPKCESITHEPDCRLAALLKALPDAPGSPETPK